MWVEDEIIYPLTPKTHFWTWYEFLTVKKSRLCPKMKENMKICRLQQTTWFCGLTFTGSVEIITYVSRGLDYLSIYQPKVPTLEFVLVRVVSCNWHVIFLLSQSKHLRQSIFENTPRLMLILTLLFPHIVLSARYSVFKILHTLPLPFV